MNRERAKALLPIITAFAEGKTIQSRSLASSCIKWDDLTDPTFSYPPETYRIKPEPIECWVNEYASGRGGKCFATKEEAKLAGGVTAIRQVFLREVLG